MSELVALIASVCRRVSRVVVIILGMYRFHSSGVRPGKGLVLYGLPIISLAEGSRLEIGRRVALCSWSSYTALGVNHPVILRTLTPDASLLIGDNVGISGGTMCAARRVSIGASTLVGANVTISDTDFHTIFPENRRYNRDPEKVNSEEVAIGENVFIGASSIVLKGVSIGDNSVIGAGSVVTRDIPENVVAAGNPCRVLGSVWAGAERRSRGLA